MKAFIFDLDGTLLDTLEDIGHACNTMLRAHNLPTHAIDDYRGMVGNGFSNLVGAALPPEYAQSLTPADFENLVHYAHDYYAAHLSIHSQPYPGMLAALNELSAHDFYLAVLSNKPDNLTKALVAQHFPHNTFFTVRGSRLGTPLKPDPTSARSVADSLGLAPEYCFYVGDSDVDILTARRAGMVSVGVSWGFRGLDEVLAAGANFIARYAADLPAIPDTLRAIRVVRPFAVPNCRSPLDKSYWVTKI